MLSFSRLRAAGKVSSAGSGDAAPLEHAAARLVPQLGAVVEAYHQKFGQDPELALLTRKRRRGGEAGAGRALARPPDRAGRRGVQGAGAPDRRGVRQGGRFPAILPAKLPVLLRIAWLSGPEAELRAKPGARSRAPCSPTWSWRSPHTSRTPRTRWFSAAPSTWSSRSKRRCGSRIGPPRSRADDLTEIVGELSRSMEELRRGFEMMEGSSRTNRDEIKSVASAIEALQAQQPRGRRPGGGDVAHGRARRSPSRRRRRGAWRG